MPAHNVTLYAQWSENEKYSVTYDANGGTGSQTDANSPYYEGAVVTVLDKGSIARTHYTFTGWNTAADGSGAAYAPGATFSMPAHNVTLYAQWSENPKYNVYYDNNEGEGSQSDSNDYYEGDTVTVLDEGTMSMAGGYVFDGWNTAANGSGTAYNPGDTFSMPAADVTLYAQWVCDPCSGWDATGVTVYLWYAGSHGHSDPRIDVDGVITGPACAELTEIDIMFVLYNKGGNPKETYTDTLTSQNNSFTVELDIAPAKYNAGDNYKLFVSVSNCGWVLVKSGPVELKP